MWQAWQRYAGRVIDLVFPHCCFQCSQPVASQPWGGFCEHCWNAIRLIQPPYCPCCGEPFGSPVALRSSPDYRCGACRAHPPAFDQARAIGEYQGTLRQAIHLLKYQGKLRLQRPLVQLATEHFHSHFPDAAYDAIIPVPLHHQRLMSREFNQAAVLANGLAIHLQVPVVERLLVRQRPTRPQVELSGRERRRNVQQAFTVSDNTALIDKRVLVVDDVLTTGATLGEVARTLKGAGAVRVDVFALARVRQG